MAARHTVDKLFIAQDAGGRTITPRIVGGAITPTNSESVMLPIQVNDLGQLVTGNVSDPSAVTAPYYTLSKVSGSIVKSSPGILNSIYGFNSGSGQFIQIHNLDEQPLNGAISVLPI